MAHFYFARCSWTLLPKIQEHSIFYFLVSLALHSPLTPTVAKNYLAPWFRPNITSFGKPVHLTWKFTLFFLCYLDVPSAFILLWILSCAQNIFCIFGSYKVAGSSSTEIPGNQAWKSMSVY